MKPSIQLILKDPVFFEQWGVPTYATIGSAGLDLRAHLQQSLTVRASQSVLIPTGLAIYLKDPGLAAMILPRSGLGHKKGIILGNGTGVIDSDYQGEISISCWNRSQEDFTIQPGDRIAQLVVVPIIQIQFEVVDHFAETERGAGGFGSTGLGSAVHQVAIKAE